MKCVCFFVPRKKMININLESPDSFLNRRFIVGNIYDYETRIIGTVFDSSMTEFLVKYQSISGIENIVYSEEKFNKIFKTLSEYRNLKLEEILS